MSFRVSSTGNPPRVQTNSHRDIHRLQVSTGRKPTEEIADRSKVTLVFDISYLFSAKTTSFTGLTQSSSIDPWVFDLGVTVRPEKFK